MLISIPDGGALCEEQTVIDSLPLNDARILELGCGRAGQTRLLAQRPGVRSVLALEVDALQHAKNLALSDLPTVRFALGAAEAIPAPDASVDGVFLFKSLHHVPAALMDQAFAEIDRVLVPGGFVYVSEPVFDGAYNDVLRLFHDEQAVRTAAFHAIERAVASARFTLLSETFFRARVHFPDFAAFERNVINVTHTDHRLSASVLAEVRSRFDAHLTEDGAQFAAPMRVDILKKSTHQSRSAP